MAKDLTIIKTNSDTSEARSREAAARPFDNKSVNGELKKGRMSYL